MSDEIEKNNIMNFPSEDMDNLRILEALLFAANEPLDAESLKARLPKGTNLNKLLNLIEYIPSIYSFFLFLKEVSIYCFLNVY